jgi:uncharacterized protein YodC (DUF2158 family)
MLMPDDFKIGDKVQLKIGGAVMTVSYTPFPAPGVIWCSWALDNTVVAGCFRTDTLRRIDTAGPVRLK